MEWKKLVGQERVKATLGLAVKNGALGHAYLFSGKAGVGKFQAALELASALLCDNENHKPCYLCDSCRKINNHAHPDFNLIMPVYLNKEHKGSDGKLNENGWEYIDEKCKEKIQEPYRINQSTGIATIPVDWVREINHSILRGSVDERANISIICGIDAMKKEPANAILKTLEEPPQNSIIILITEHPHAVLPTILSRCQIVRFGYIGDNEMTKALCERTGAEAGDTHIKHVVSCAEGSLGRALRLMDQPLENSMDEARELFSMCLGKDWSEIGSRLDNFISNKLQGGRDYGGAEYILANMQYLIRDSYLYDIGVAAKYFRKEFVSLEAKKAVQDAHLTSKALHACQWTIDAIKARGNVHMVLATFLFKMMEIMYGEKQPTC